MRMPLGIQDLDVVQPDVEELVYGLESSSDAEVVLELDGHLCFDARADEDVSTNHPREREKGHTLIGQSLENAVELERLEGRGGKGERGQLEKGRREGGVLRELEDEREQKLKRREQWEDQLELL